MAYTEFTGELDGAAKGGYVPFNGALDEPKGFIDRASDELSSLRDSFFTGVDNVRASIKTVNTGGLANRMQGVAQRLEELEAKGQGDSISARQMRNELKSVQEKLPRTIGDMTEAQGDAQRGAQMTTRPAVAKLNEAKTFGDAWSAFKEAPYDVIAGVTATSLPAMLPGLVAAAAMGPGAGAVTMGANSAIVEAGSSLADFARDKGVNMTDPKAVEAFFTNRENLAQAMAFAGKRAGIIGTVDAVSGGIAAKTLAPPMKSVIGRQTVNLPAQMGVQAGLGGVGEAGAQIATKGKIDQPGQVLAEVVGGFGTAPLEVAAFSGDVRQALAKKGVAPAEPVTTNGTEAVDNIARILAPTPKADPVPEILNAPDVDAAINAATAALASQASATEALNRIDSSREMEAAWNAYDAALSKSLSMLDDIRDGKPGAEEAYDRFEREVKGPARLAYDKLFGGAAEPQQSPDKATQQEGNSSVDSAVVAKSTAVANDPAALLDRQMLGGDPLQPILQARTEREAVADGIQAEAEARKAAEMESIPGLASEQNTVQAALERAASLEAPTALQLALQKANVAPAPAVEAAPAQPAAPALARVVERTEGMIALPQKLAEQRAAANPQMEVVRFANIDRATGQPNGKFAYTVIPKAADVSAPVLAAGMGADSASGRAVVGRGDGNQPSSSAVPLATWVGRRGDGYVTREDASMALPSRQRVEPDLSWKIEQMPTGKFRLAGYASGVVKSGDATLATSSTAPGVGANPTPGNAPVDGQQGADAATVVDGAGSARAVPAATQAATPAVERFGVGRESDGSPPLERPAPPTDSPIQPTVTQTPPTSGVSDGVTLNAFGVPEGYRPGPKKTVTVADLTVGDWISFDGNTAQVKAVAPSDKPGHVRLTWEGGRLGGALDMNTEDYPATAKVERKELIKLNAERTEASAQNAGAQTEATAKVESDSTQSVESELPTILPYGEMSPEQQADYDESQGIKPGVREKNAAALEKIETQTTETRKQIAEIGPKGAQTEARNEALIDLRKRASVLKSLRLCLGA